MVNVHTIAVTEIIALKIGLSTLFLTTKSFSALIKSLEAYGEECKSWEIVDEGKTRLNKRRVNLLNQLKRSYSFDYAVHTPFCDINIASLNHRVRSLNLKLVKESVARAAMLEAKMFVTHPGFYDPFNLDITRKVNVESIRKLARHAEQLGVPISIENMPPKYSATLSEVKDFELFFEELNPDNLGLTLDVGHAHMTGQLPLFLEKFQHKIKHVHLHDNDGSFDHHKALGEGTVSWSSLLTKLNLNSFQELIMVESIEKPYESFLKLKEELSKL